MTRGPSGTRAAGALPALAFAAGVAGLFASGATTAARAAESSAPDGATAARASPTTASTSAASGAVAGVPPPATDDPAPPDTVVVEATDRLVFRSDSVVIDAGDAVRWKNAGVIQHTATADPAKATLEEIVHLPKGADPFDSGRLVEGETFTHVFTVPGRYDYFCIPHEGAGMTGTVIVEE